MPGVEGQRQNSSNVGSERSANDGIAVEAIRLSRRFGNVTALDSVSLEIRAGEFFSLLGPSGCGKTTLLRLISGLDVPDDGKLNILGREASDWPAHSRPINTVFQSYALFPHMSVWENVAFGLRMKKVPDPELKQRVQRVMEMVQISDLQTRKPAEISGGQKQRVALARAVVNEPKILLLDEPLGALDLKLRKQLQLELHQLQRRLNITFVYVTHDQEEALTMSDRIAVMNHGKIEQLAASEELYETPCNRFVAEFLGSCNLVEGIVDSHSAGELIVRAPGLGGGLLKVRRLASTAQNGSKITLAIRPEKMVLAKIGAEGRVNHMSATVQDVIYSGAETNYLLRATDMMLRSCVFNAVGHEQFRIGEKITVQLPPEALVPLED